jgi:hypothetical protein
MAPIKATMFLVKSQSVSLSYTKCMAENKVLARAHGVCVCARAWGVARVRVCIILHKLQNVSYQ